MSEAKPEIRPGDLVLHKDHQILVMNKPTGMPVQADKSKEKSLLDLGEIYTKQKLHLSNRLDRPVGGLVLMAKNSNAAADLTEQLKKRTLKKTYLAVTAVKLPEDSGKLVHHIKRDGSLNRSLALDEANDDTVEAVLEYKLLNSSERYFLYEVNLITGRHHQIRAQFGKMGCPIRGDEKYGFKRANKDRSIDLFCLQVEFVHPTKKEPVKITAPFPKGKLWEAFNLK